MPKFNVSYAIYGAISSMLENGTEFQTEHNPIVLSLILNAAGASGIVKCTNETFIYDPSYGDLKHFGALVNGRYFACAEGQTIDFNHGGGLPSGMSTPPSPLINVKFAVYGALASGVATACQALDVTWRLQAILNKTNGRSAIINNVNFGDPSPNNKKHFAAVVSVAGNDIYIACEEGQTIQVA